MQWDILSYSVDGVVNLIVVDVMGKGIPAVIVTATVLAVMLVHSSGRFQLIGVMTSGSELCAPAPLSEQEAVLAPGDTLLAIGDGLFDLMDGTRAVFADLATMAIAVGSAAELINRITTRTGPSVLIDDAQWFPASQRDRSQWRRSGYGLEGRA